MLFIQVEHLIRKSINNQGMVKPLKENWRNSKRSTQFGCLYLHRFKPGTLSLMSVIHVSNNNISHGASMPQTQIRLVTYRRTGDEAVHKMAAVAERTFYWALPHPRRHPQDRASSGRRARRVLLASTPLHWRWWARCRHLKDRSWQSLSWLRNSPPFIGPCSPEPAMDPTISHFNQDHSLRSYSSSIYFNIVLPFMPRSSNWTLTWGLPITILYVFLIFPYSLI
jgi:hypothetical protein